MYVKITEGGSGSCGGLVDYLEKEEKGNWFSQDKETITPLNVTNTIDQNKRNLGKDELKFYQVIISPSEKELVHINNDPKKLQQYTRAIMEDYAEKFGKGIKSKDLVWYGKIEYDRKYTFRDQEVKEKQKIKGSEKENLNTHIHVIVSRTENLESFKEGRANGEIDRKNPLKLSPLTNHKETEKGAVKGGFNRMEFKQKAESKFDEQFNYSRKLTESLRYSHTLEHGSEKERTAIR